MSNRHRQGFASMPEEKQRLASSKGGSAKVPKGTSMLTPEERREKASQAAKARWAKVRQARAIRELEESENNNG